MQNIYRMPLFDRGYFYSLTGDDEQLRKQLIDIFMEDAGTIFTQLAAHEVGDDIWSEAAHKLRGSSINLGLMRLSELAGAAEKDSLHLSTSVYRDAIRKTFEESCAELLGL